MRKPESKPIILAFGFEKFGFLTPQAETESDRFVLRFVNYDNPSSWSEAKGIIVPSGIFEKRQEIDGRPFGANYFIYDGDVHAIAERTKQLLNHLESGGWIAVLMRRIDYGERNQWANTDLSKRIINSFFEGTDLHEPIANIECKSDEFRAFFKEFGIAETTLIQPKDTSIRVLATAGRRIVAAEFNGSFFFLPVPRFDPDRGTPAAMLAAVCDSILKYKAKNDFYLPAWAEQLRLASEIDVQNRIDQLEKELVTETAALKTFVRYKGILTTSGRHLNSCVVGVLREFFGLRLSSDEAFIEDALIQNGKGETLYAVEIKGVNAGVKREHINQVDSHRERLNISSDIPGLLIINDFMDCESLEEREKKPVAGDHLRLAQSQNVRILRTATLFRLMLNNERINPRGAVFLEACANADPLVTA